MNRDPLTIAIQGLILCCLFWIGCGVWWICQEMAESRPAATAIYSTAITADHVNFLDDETVVEK